MTLRNSFTFQHREQRFRNRACARQAETAGLQARQSRRTTHARRKDKSGHDQHPDLCREAVPTVSPLIPSDTQPGGTDPRELANIVPHMARSLLGLVEDRGLPPERFCRGLGFSYQDLMDHHLLLSYKQIRALIQRTRLMLDDPAIGLASGARQTPVSWGVAGLAMLTCETFEEAIAYGIEHQRDAGAMLSHLFEVDGREIYLEVLPHIFDLEIEPFLVEEAFSGLLAVGGHLLGESFKPLRVDLSFSDDGRMERYRSHFRCPIRFDAGCNRMSFASHWLSARLPGYDRITCGLVRNQLGALLKHPDGRPDLVESVANRIRFSIEEKPSQKEMAQMVNLSERTLRRKLGEQKTTYRALKDGTRFERARDLLINSDMTIVQIAEIVGYADARAFRRAFKRWSGRLPGSFRASGKQ